MKLLDFFLGNKQQKEYLVIFHESPAVIMYHVWHLSKVTTKRTNVCSLGIYPELQKNLSLPKGYTSCLKVVIDLEI